MKIINILKKVPSYVYISIFVFIILLFLLQIREIIEITHYIESPVYDIALKVKKKPRLHKDIVLVTITDATDREIGSFPWKDHSTYKEFVGGLKLLKPKLVVWDVVFLPRAENDQNLEFKAFANMYRKINSVSAFSLSNLKESFKCDEKEYEELKRYLKSGFKKFLLEDSLVDFREINNHNLLKCINQFVERTGQQFDDFKSFLNNISDNAVEESVNKLIYIDTSLHDISLEKKRYIKTQQIVNKIFKDDDTGVISELYRSFVNNHSTTLIKNFSKKINVVSEIDVPSFDTIDPVSHVLLSKSAYTGFANVQTGKYNIIRGIPLVYNFQNTYLLSLPLSAYLIYTNADEVILTKDTLIAKQSEKTIENIHHNNNTFLVDFLAEMENAIDAQELIFLYRKYDTIRFNILENFELLKDLESQLFNSDNIKYVVKKNLSLPAFVRITEKLAKSLRGEILNLMAGNPPDEELVSYEKIRDFLSMVIDLSGKLKEQYKRLYRRVNNKVVFVGASKTGADLKSVSLTSNYPGLLVHVSAFNSLLTKTNFEKTPKWVSYLIICIILTVCYYFIIKRGAIATGLFLIIALSGLFFLKVELLNRKKYFEYADTFILLFFPIATSIIIKERAEGKTKKMLKQTFQNYISKDVLEYLIAHPQKIRLGGEMKEATVFFSDMSGFTTFSEKYRPEYVISVLNEYLKIITENILENRGFLDKYEGDGVMAAFGVPIEFPESAECACKASCRIKKELKQLHEESKESGLPVLTIRIGLSTGKIIAGNIGSEKRLDYTLIGDYVNLGNRLEQANKSFGTTILMEENTYNKVKDKFYTRKIGIIKVKGKERYVSVYELIDERPSSNVDEHFIELFDEAVELFLSKRTRDAKYLFEKLQKMHPEDNPTKKYLSICNELMKLEIITQEDLVIKLG
ncbi:MAG: adenylate/guanylate cyclase domain-containing protein [Planctomycetota bacterium]